MDRLLVSLGSLLAAAAVVFGVVQTSRAADAPSVSLAGMPPAPSKDALDWRTLLGYEYQPGLLGVPDAIKAREGTAVVLRGFLLPLIEFDDIHEFCLVPNHMSCCFGMPAGINGQVQVRLAGGERGLPNTNEPLEVRGTFHVVETKDQGILLSIYRLDAASARIVGY
jgi:hypothetical protein